MTRSNHFMTPPVGRAGAAGAVKHPPARWPLLAALALCPDSSRVASGGFQQNGGVSMGFHDYTPIVRWMISGKIPSMDDWGPYDETGFHQRGARDETR